MSAVLKREAERSPRALYTRDSLDYFLIPSVSYHSLCKQNIYIYIYIYPRLKYGWPYFGKDGRLDFWRRSHEQLSRVFEVLLQKQKHIPTSD
jgi:hypothetical protein